MADPRPASRWSLSGGTDPDPRFTLANERTFLAWIRTGLALIAGAVALEGFGLHLDPTVRSILAAGLVVIGAAVGIGAGIRWVRVEQAMRHGRALPFPSLIPLLVLVTVLVAIVLLALVAF